MTECAAPAAALALRSEIGAGMHTLATARAGAYHVTFALGRDSLWALVRAEGKTGFALRLAQAPGGGLVVTEHTSEGQAHVFALSSPLGAHDVHFETLGDAVRWRTRLTPSEDLRLPFLDRDLYVLGEGDDPLAARGEVKAAQRGLNVGLVYLTCRAPSGVTALYLQDLSPLNPYFEAAAAQPDTAVGGAWPELGYLPPAKKRDPPPLPKGRDLVVSSGQLHLQDGVAADERESARRFLDLLAAAYADIEKPDTQYRDWIGRAEETLRHLRRSPKATETHYKRLYIRPYTDAEYPDSMVQLTLVAPISDYCGWRDRETPLCGELRAGVDKFFDKRLGAMRRYLPDVGADKNADEVDSWYLYHPLMNLGRLALAGDKGAEKLFLQSLDYAIRVARRFKYDWPVKFHVETLKVLQGPRKEGQPGQSDVGGLYAYVMLQAHKLTGEKRYFTEAERGIQALTDLQFQLEYQSNITAWGAAAGFKLWTMTGLDFFRDQSFVLLAGFFHNSVIWESEQQHAKHYSTFLGATCLHDASYMALYECWESYAAFHECFDIAGDELPASLQLLMAEYMKHALNRAWFYYPKELPEEALADQQRNGHIDCALAFPLEDLYPSGEPAGQVGQEIYGAGAAFAFVTHAYRRVTGAPFYLYCAYPITEPAATARHAVSFRVLGPGSGHAELRLIPKGRAVVGEVQLEGRDGAQSSVRTEDGHIAFHVSGGDALTLSWSPVRKR